MGDAALDLGALDAHVVWRAPDDVLAWLADGPLRRLVGRPQHPTISVEFSWGRVGDEWQCVHDEAHMRSTELAACVDEAMIVVNRLAAMSVADDRLVLHAGVVRRPDGGCVALCGASGTGKSTATAAAVLAGWGYVADEVCALDVQAMTVRPFPRPIGLRPGGRAALGLPEAEVRWWEPPTAVADEPVLTAVAMLHRSGGPPRATRLSPAAALERLADRGLATGGTDRVSFRRLEQLVRTVPVFDVEYTDAAGSLRVVAGLDDR